MTELDRLMTSRSAEESVSEPGAVPGPAVRPGRPPGPPRIDRVSGAGRMSARRAALLVAAGLGAVLVVVIAVVPPWTLLAEPAGGRSPADPAGVLPPDLLERAQTFAAPQRPASGV